MDSYQEEYDKIHKARIDEIYSHITSSIKGGRIYGRDIDMNNEKEVAVAAYLYGKTEGQDT